MGHKLADEELELYRRVDEVLFYVWDPLGVANSPAARDEYYGYLPIVFSMLQGEGANVSTIAAYLDNIASLRMGLDANPEHSNRVAELLLDWKTEVRAILHGRSKPPDQNKSSASMRTSFLKRATSGRSRSPSNLSTQGLVRPRAMAGFRRANWQWYCLKAARSRRPAARQNRPM